MMKIAHPAARPAHQRTASVQRPRSVPLPSHEYGLNKGSNCSQIQFWPAYPARALLLLAFFTVTSSRSVGVSCGGGDGLLVWVATAAYGIVMIFRCSPTVQLSIVVAAFVGEACTCTVGLAACDGRWWWSCPSHEEATRLAQVSLAWAVMPGQQLGVPVGRCLRSSVWPHVAHHGTP